MQPLTDPAFAHVETWIFDLDNTLYPARLNLFTEVDRRIGEFVARVVDVLPEEAARLRKDYFLRYGSTLRGLMLEHRLQPEEFLHYVHDIDLALVLADERLDRALARLPGRKLIFTNGTVRHAERITERLGIAHHFEAVFDIVHSGYLPKPSPEPYDALLARFGVRPTAAAMFEDIARNLKPAHERGMRTVWVGGNTSQWATQGAEEGHVQHVTEDLAGFLDGLAGRAD